MQVCVSANISMASDKIYYWLIYFGRWVCLGDTAMGDNEASLEK